ncbi:group III truncated hemoglobin [Streptomyces sp. NPDC005968]|uniref:group III truncated hemoglobin n=1 Tax=Streptomyces sp. NPDC005968 TaxID=3154574 RepID=UPI0033FC71BE
MKAVSTDRSPATPSGPATLPGSAAAGADRSRLRDLSGRTDVEDLVRGFYRAAFADPLIGAVFTDVARMDLEAHMPVMCDFWESVLFRAGKYHGNALQPHLALNRSVALEQQHFARWLGTWQATVDSLFLGEKAELAKTQAVRIGGSLLRRLHDGDASEYVTVRRRENG